jgi:phosphocarrier protein HPr
MRSAPCVVRAGMEIQNFTIRNRLGLHARAAALLVKTANRFASEVVIEKDGLEVNGKSIMGILMLAAAKGSRITLKVEGKDSSQALQALGKLIENKFGEE